MSHDIQAVAAESHSPWSNPAYRRFWASETISLLGSYVTNIALPLIAIRAFNASSAEVGIINASRFAPFLLLTIAAGALVDRLPRRKILVFTRLASATALFTIAIVAVAGLLSLWSMALAAFIIGALSVVDQLAYQATIRAIVTSAQLLRANSALTASDSAASVSGPGVGGALVSILPSGLALLVDAVSFAISAVILSRLRIVEPAREPTAWRKFPREVTRGMLLLSQNRFLWPVVFWATMYNFAQAAFFAVSIVWMTKKVGLDGLIVGIIFAVGGLGSLAGARLARYAESRIGSGRTLTCSVILAGMPMMLAPIASGRSAVIIIAPACLGLAGMGTSIANILSLSLRQRAIPSAVFGSVTGAVRTLNWGVIPLGSLIGGVLGSLISLRTVVFLAGIGMTFAAFSLLRGRIVALPAFTESSMQALWRSA